MPKPKIVLSGKREVAPVPKRFSRPVISKIDLPDYIAETKALEAEMWRPFQLLDPRMLESHDLSDPKNISKYPRWIDPQTGRECYARIVDITWIETGRRRRKGQVESFTRAHRIKPGELMTANDALKEKASKRKRNLIENWEGGFATGGMDNQILPLGDVIQYPPGPFTRQLYLQAMWDMQARCFEIYNHYGIAKSAINTISYFVIGDGVKVDFIDDEAQEVWDEFAERTHLDRDLQQYSMMLSVNGELIFHMPKMDGGLTDLISIDPGTLWEKITVPKDIRKVKAYWVQYATQYQLYSVDGVPLADYIIEQLKPEEVIHVTINIQNNEKRGRSDLLASLPDLKELQDITRYKAVGIINHSALVFDQKITGQDTDVTAIAGLQTDFLGAGTTYTHNESSELEIVDPKGSGEEKSGFHDEMLAQIGTGTGSMPAEFVGGGSGSNRANALTKTEPSYKFFRSRQKKFEYTIKDIAKIVMANWNLAHGTNVSDDCEVIFPEIAPEDRKEKLANIVLMESQEYWDHEKAATTAAKEMDDTSYDYEITQTKIQEERELDPQLAFLFQPQASGAVGGVQNPGPAAPGSNAPKPAPGGKPQLGPAQPLGSTKPSSQYKNNSMGLGSDVKKSIKTQMKQSEAEKHGFKGEHKKGHHMIHRGLRSRTKHTLAGEEALSAGAFPAQMRSVDEAEADGFKQEWEAFKKHPYSKVDFGEVSPPGWKGTVDAMKKHPEISNPYPLAWWMDNQGYTPHKG